jgi:hypothetical protein
MAIKAETSTTVHKTIRLTAAQIVELLGKRRVPEGATKLAVGIATEEGDGIETLTPIGEDQVVVVQFDLTREGAK